MRALLLILACLCAGCFCSYSTDTHFQCGEEWFPLSHLNDDYCDCKDGSDEPSTSACSKHGGQFLCKNEKFKSVLIPSSRAFDGVCDCCDASDELPGVCQNTCHQAAEAANKVVRAEIEEQEAGLAALKEDSEAFRQLSIEKTKKKETLEQLQPTLEKERDGFQAQVNEAERKIKDLEAALKVQFEASVNAEVETWLVEKKAQDELKKLEEIQRKAEEEKKRLEENPEPEAHAEHPAEPAAEEVPVDYNALKEEKFSEFLNTKFEASPERQQLVKEKNDLESKTSELSRKIDDNTRDISDIDKFLTTDTGPSHRFAYMLEKTFSQRSGEYEYKVSPWVEAWQGHTSVGKWARWENNYSQMKFEGGQRCWGGPDRSLLIDLFCGRKTELLDVKEPNKCEYLMRMKTPGACSEERLKELKAQLH